MICPVCKADTNQMLYKNYTGYVEGTSFDIFKCSNCLSHYIDIEKLDQKIYDTIYSSENTPGYDRYYNYAIKIKSSKNPLKFLAFEEETYYPIYQYLKNQTKLEILEIGSGYGYTSYAMKRAGHLVTGVDISKQAVSFATKNFGDFYINSRIEDYKTSKKFDLIVATELFEHLSNPNQFLEIVKKLLKPNGKIIITTPNKDYCDQTGFSSIWQSDLPPVHTFWLTTKGAELIAKQNDFKIEFISFKSYSEPNQNPIINFLKIKREKIPDHNIKISKNETPKSEDYNQLTHFIKTKILQKFPIRNLSAYFLYYIMGVKQNRTMVFILTNNSNAV